MNDEEKKPETEETDAEEEDKPMTSSIPYSTPEKTEEE